MRKKLPKLETLRHSTAHLMAAAVKRLDPAAKLGIGPIIENGFYYDFDTKLDLSPEQFSRIQQEMHVMIHQALPFRKEWLTIKKAIAFFKKRQEPYKVELIGELARKQVRRVSIYWTGDPSADGFADLCTGPHVRSTRDIPENAFALLKSAAAYWRGDEKNPQLKRIYGTVFSTKKELAEYIKLQEEIERRDHRHLGQRLDLFSFHDIAPGSPFWHPKGMIVVKELERHWRAIHDRAGYQEISTPILVKEALFEKSGHLRYYKENMFTFEHDGERYALKPMNCPESTYVYNSRVRSFRDLPLRLSEIGRLHRDERSGVLSGLLRVRQITMDDAHIFIRPDQIEQEIRSVLKIAGDFYKLFDFRPRFFLATKPDKAMGPPSLWKKAETSLRQALKKERTDFKVKPKEGAFYAPKIDIHISDALDRDWQLATIQVDLAMLPERFDLSYIDKDGKKKRPIVIHRAIFGSFERFIGILLEHTAGELPFWLAPVQIQILPIATRHLEEGAKTAQALQDLGFRVELALPEETLGKRIREGELSKIPYLAVMGDREIETDSISLRNTKNGKQQTIPRRDLAAFFEKDIQT